ncbi:MAG: FG-GAP-like repeat-containing protein [Candidatus Bathyarchaeota archaeon]|nr:FG-GAP-like repeat-containing protein [Candidatus Bathyarchaeota archaeon]
MADVDNDGRLEIIVPLQQPAGLVILNSEDLSILWNAPGTYSGNSGYFTNPAGGRVDSSPVIGDIDGDGYKDIFVGIMAYEEQPETGSLRHLEYDPSVGTIVQRQVRIVWHPCAGGLSLGDTDNDGTYELYMADRSQGGMPDGSWGRGLRSFWAENLTSRWDLYDNMMSSNIPMLADVNDDGIRDVVATDLSRAVLVLNSSNGHPLTNDEGTILRGSISERRNHYQSSIYDIDGDGNLEILSADGFEASYDNVTVWDLWDWALDASINTTLVGTVPTRSWKGPTVGEVTGDGLMDIIVTTFEFENNSDRGMVQVYDHNYNLVAYTPNNLRHRAIESVVQDVDKNADGLNELLVLTQGGVIYCFETSGIAANPRARSEVQFYSESRLGASEYVPYEPPYTNASYPSSPSIPNDAPTHGTPILSGSADTDNLICYNQSTTDPDGNSVTNIYSWAKNGVSIANLILPFDAKTNPELEYSGFAYTKDYSGYGNLGNVFGASWTGAGRVGGAYSFDGNDFIKIEEQGTSLGGDGTWDEIAVEFWVKAIENTGNETLLWKHDRYEFSKGGFSSWTGLYTPSSGIGYRVDFAADDASNQITWYIYTPNASDPETSIAYVALANIYENVKDWHHVVCTYKSGEGLRVYVDGVEAGALLGVSGNIVKTNGSARSRYLGDMLGDWGYIFSGGMMDTNKGPLEIGRERTSGDFKGILDEIRIYPSAVSTDQIYLRYIDTKSGFGTQSTISHEETTVGDQWRCQVTPNDGLADGTTINTNTVTIQSGQPQQYSLLMNVVGNGITDPSAGTHQYTSGTVVTLTADPADDYVFSGWSGAVTGTTNPTTVTMDANKTVTATFTPQSEHLFADDFESGTLSAWAGQESTATVVTTNPHGGTYCLRGSLTSGANNGWSGAYTSVSGANPVTLNAWVYFNAPPNTDNEDQWALCFSQSTAGNALAYAGVRQSSGPNYWAIWYISSGTTLTYQLSSTPYTSGWHYVQLSINRGTANNGWVELRVDGALVCSAYTLDNDGRTLSYARVGFSYSDAPSAASSTVFIDDVTIDSSSSPPPTQYSLTVNVVGSGSVTKNPNQSTYISGTPVELTAVPASGWSFSGWSGDLTGSTNPATITMNSNKTVTATFTENPPTQYTLTVNIVGSGSVSKNPNQATYTSGTPVELTATAATGYTFTGWSGDLTGTTNPATIIMNANKVVTATFTVNSAHLFEDTFESGTLSAWTGQDGTTTVSSANPYQGTYHLSCSIASGANNGWSGVYQSITGTNPVRLNAYVFFNNPPNTNDEDQWVLAFTQNTAANALAYAGIRQVDGTLYWSIWYYSGTALVYQVSSTPYSAGWHNLELSLNRGTANDGWVQLYVDGALTCSASNLDNDGRTLNYARVGFSYSDAASAATSTIHIDNVTIDT